MILSKILHMATITKNINWKNVVSVGGALIGVASLAVSLIIYFWGDKKPKIEMILETNAEVIDIKDDVPNLAVMFKGEDLKASHKQLTLLTFKILNNSSTSILQDYYDSRIPWGIEIRKGALINVPQIMESPAGYTDDDFLFKIDNRSKIIFPKIILDGGSSFRFKCLIMLSENDILTTDDIIPFGKIGNVGSIDVLDQSKVNGMNQITQDGKNLAIVILSSLLTIVSIMFFTFDSKEEKYWRTQMIFSKAISESLRSGYQDYLQKKEDVSKVNSTENE